MENFSSGQIFLTMHAQLRLHARRISVAAIEMVLLFGREKRVRGATLYAIGRREVERIEEEGVDLRGYEGIHVVCGRGSEVVTVYRNRNFRGLRPRRFRRKRIPVRGDRYLCPTPLVA